MPKTTQFRTTPTRMRAIPSREDDRQDAVHVEGSGRRRELPALPLLACCHCSSVPRHCHLACPRPARTRRDSTDARLRAVTIFKCRDGPVVNDVTVAARRRRDDRSALRPRAMPYSAQRRSTSSCTSWRHHDPLGPGAGALRLPLVRRVDSELAAVAVHGRGMVELVERPLRQDDVPLRVDVRTDVEEDAARSRGRRRSRRRPRRTSRG